MKTFVVFSFGNTTAFNTVAVNKNSSKARTDIFLFCCSILSWTEKLSIWAVLTHWVKDADSFLLIFHHEWKREYVWVIYIYIYICSYICIYIRIYAYLYIYIGISIYLSIYLSIYIYLSICLSISLSIYRSVDLLQVLRNINLL